LWSEKYDRELKDVFEIQDEISMAIVENLKIHLFEKEREKVLKSKTKDLEAYNLYLKGRYHWNKRTRDGLLKSTEYFEQSIQCDVNFALAYTGLSDAYNILSDWGYMLPREAFCKAKNNVLKSIEIDNGFGESFASLAFINCFFEWDWKSAERNFKNAIDLNPSYAMGYHWHALFLIATNRVKTAYEQINTAILLDPLSLAVNFAKGYILYLLRRYDEAITQLQKTAQLNNKIGIAHLYSAMSYLKKDDRDMAIKELIHLFETDPTLYKFILEARDYAKSTQLKEFFGFLIRRKIVPNKEVYNLSFYLSQFYSAIEKTNEAISHIEKALDMRNTRTLCAISADPVYDPIKRDPAFQNLLTKVGF
jgi:tetratricopeptide (TPR) repeat protein